MPNQLWTAPAYDYLDCTKKQRTLIKAQNPAKASSAVRREAKKQCKENGDAIRSYPTAGRKP
jgi:hypothetical protein